jgi:hypothetical protein
VCDVRADFKVSVPDQIVTPFVQFDGLDPASLNNPKPEQQISAPRLLGSVVMAERPRAAGSAYAWKVCQTVSGAVGQASVLQWAPISSCRSHLFNRRAITDPQFFQQRHPRPRHTV